MRPLLVAILLVGPLLGCNPFVGPAPAPPPSGLIEWPARGNLATNKEFVAAATAAWDRGTFPDRFGPPRIPLPAHTGGVRVLYAASWDLGRIAVLEGRDMSRSARLVVINDDHGMLQMTNDVPLPFPETTHELTVLRTTLDGGAPDAEGRDVFRKSAILVIGEPGTKFVELSLVFAPGHIPSVVTAPKPVQVDDGVAVTLLTAARSNGSSEFEGDAGATEARLSIGGNRQRTVVLDMAGDPLASTRCSICQ